MAKASQVLAGITTMLAITTGMNTARADSAEIVFDKGFPRPPVQIGGTARFTLQDDGTVRATVNSFGGNIFRLYFNSPTHQEAHAFTDSDSYSLGPPTGPYDWITAGYGFYNSGWVDPTYNAREASWTIGAPGSFKSVWDAFSPNSMGYSVWFGALDTTEPGNWNSTEWVGKLVASPVPEPSSAILLALGVLVASYKRRKPGRLASHRTRITGFCDR